MHAFMNNTEVVTTTIANGATTSSAISIGGRSIVGLIISTALTNATLTLQGSVDNSNFYTLREKDGTAVAITTGTTTGFYKLSPSIVDGIPYLQLVSSGAEGSSRTIPVVLTNYKG